MKPKQSSSRVVRWITGIFASFAAIVAILLIAANVALNTDTVAPGTVQKTATSKDGTVIAYEQTGQGPAVILVSAALADRSGARRLAGHLAERFSVINYDRRGRGASTDTQPYAVQREVEDIEALADAAGGPVFLFGSSSGSVLALDAAAALGPRVKRVFVYEPPFIVDTSRAPMPEDLTDEVTALTSGGHRSDAVKLFFVKGMGIPGPAVNLMRLFMPGWSKMAGMAHTVPYDLAILEGTQRGKPLPAERWAAVTAPTLVVVGTRSEPFFHHGARALAGLLPNARYVALEGRDHSAVLFASGALAGTAGQFYLSAGNAISARDSTLR